MEENKLLSAAKYYAGLGFNIFPCQIRGKTPATSHGFKDAKPSAAPWETGTQFNIGFSTGAGVVVLDVDVNPERGKFGNEELAALEKKYGKLPATWTSLTGSGGTHYFFSCDDPALTIAAGFAPSLDYRANGGYVILPPSVHPNGKRDVGALKQEKDGFILVGKMKNE